MKTYKELVEGINETLSFFLEEENLFEGPTHLEYSGHVGEKEYAVKVPQHKELGDYSDKGLHRKISKENPHLHHHEVTAIVNSGGEEESHEKVEHEGKTHTHHVINYQEPRHLYNEEVEGLDEISQRLASRAVVKRGDKVYGDAIERGDVADPHQEKKFTSGLNRVKKKFGDAAANKVGRRVDKAIGLDRHYKEEFDFDLFESIMLGEGDLSIRTLYNKYADHALGAGDKPEPKKAAAVKKAIVKVHGATVMGHLEKAKNAAAKNDQDSESNHFNNARNSAKTDTMSATVGKNRSSMRKEEVDLDEGRMEDLAMDMESLSHEDFKRKHRRTKQQMQDALKSEELKGSQHKIDANKNGKVDGHDFKILRNQKKARYQ